MQVRSPSPSFITADANTSSFAAALEIAKLKRLTYLKVRDAEFSNEAVCKFAVLTDLVELHLPNVRKLSSAPVAPLTNLRVLNLESNSDLKSLGGLYQHPSLTELNFSFCRSLQSHQLRLLTSVRNLQKLDVRGVPDMGNDVLIVLTSLQNLVLCFAVGTPDLTPEGWSMLQKAIPSLQTRLMPESNHNVM
jgi:Leucine-rich repeat (LRR) protein